MGCVAIYILTRNPQINNHFDSHSSSFRAFPTLTLASYPLDCTQSCLLTLVVSPPHHNHCFSRCCPVAIRDIPLLLLEDERQETALVFFLPCSLLVGFQEAIRVRTQV